MKSPDHFATERATEMLAVTRAIRRALQAASEAAQDDLLFLEAFEHGPAREATLASLQRARQLRRANPTLTAELRAEIQPRAFVTVA